MSVKYIIGIDPSLRDLGVVVLDNTGTLVESFNVTTKAGWTDHRSIDFIVEELFEKLEKYMTWPLLKSGGVVFFFEDFYYATGGRAGNGKMGGRLQLFGVLGWHLRTSGIKAYAAQPSSLVSFLCGTVPRKSADKKKAVMDWLHHNRNFYTKNDNIADAYNAAEYGYAFIIEGQRLTVRALFTR